MTRMSFRWTEPNAKRPPLKPWLWLALSLATLALCTTLLER